MIKTEHPGVYQLEDGRFKLYVTIQHPRTKKRIAKRKTLDEGTTLDEALKAKKELLTQMRQDGEPTPQRTTISGYAKTWLNTKRQRLKPRAYQTYHSALARHVLPIIGDIYADSIIRADVVEWVVHVEKLEREDGEPYSSATLKGWWRILKLLLQDVAADFGILDPTARVRPPETHTAPKREQSTLSITQLKALLAQMRLTDEARSLEARVLAFTGIRVGELYGLHWEDVGEGILTIRHSASGGALTDTKTHTARQVYLPPELQEDLAEHRRALIRDQHPGLPSGLVFPSNAGTPRYPSFLTKLLKEAAEIVGIETNVTPQVLRRTFNTLLVSAGVDRIVLRAQMGHTTEQMTERYAGVPMAEKEAAYKSVFT